MHATFRSWRCDLACHQFCLDRFRRQAAAKRVCDCERAGDASGLRASFRPAHRSALGADYRLVLEPALRATSRGCRRSPASIAIASKFLLRIDGKHIWNPAGFAIVVLLLTSSGVWISPGQWGASIWFGTLLAFLAILVLQAAQRSRHRAVLSRQPCRVAHRPRALARRSAGHSAASDAKRLAADLRLLHDFRSAHHARIRGSAVCCSPWPWRRWRIISPFSCKCGRRFMWP